MSHSAYRWGWPLAGVVSVVLATGVGCSAADPCEGESQTCLTIQVETPGEAKSDLVRAVYSLNGGPKVQQGFAATENAASSFPIVFALPLGDGGNAQVDVIAELLAAPTLRGTINETLAAGEHKRVVLTLGRDVTKLPFVGPEPRYGAGLVAVPASSPATLVLFGGVVAGEQTLSDTWEYILGQNLWQKSPSPMSPGPRQPQMVADPTTDRVLVVQGLGAGGVVQPDAWQFMPPTPGEARTWTPLNAVTSPLPPRAFAGLTIVPTMTGMPLAFFFGGIDGTGGMPRSDLWRMLSPGMANFTATASTGAPMIKAPKLLASQTDVFLIGSEENTQSVVKIWRLDNSVTPVAWMPVSTDSGAPTYRTQFATAIDPVGQQIVLFGGLGPGGVLLDDTYRFSLQGMSWSPAATSLVPPARIDASMTFAQGQFMMFGGRDSSLKQKGDNWKLTPDGWKRWL